MTNIGKKYDGLAIFSLKFKEIRLIVLNEQVLKFSFFFFFFLIFRLKECTTRDCLPILIMKLRRNK